MNRKKISNLKGTSPRQFESQIKHLVNRCSKCHSPYPDGNYMFKVNSHVTVDNVYYSRLRPIHEVIGNALATSIMQIPEIRIFHKIMLLEIHHRHQIMFSIHTVLINSRVLKVFLLAVTII